MSDDNAREEINALLAKLVELGGSDLFVTSGWKPSIKVDGVMSPIGGDVLGSEASARMVRSIMTERQAEEFRDHNECQFAISSRLGRFRVSAFVQRGSAGAIVRRISTEIPSLDALGLPDVLKEVIMSQRGLVIFAGATGSGKTTSQAAMVGYRNAQRAGHIISIEDPIEFLHHNDQSIVTQREIGVDTFSWEVALQNVLRQAPDVIQIGEVRARETMNHAINFAETGHLVLCTLHANNANQALDRILNFYDQSERDRILMDLSLNLRGVISQRLVRQRDGGRAAALEVLLDSPYVRDLIYKGLVGEIKEAMARGANDGMFTLDQSLFHLYDSNCIDYEEAMRHADSRNELRLKIKLESRRETRDPSQDPDFQKLSIAESRAGTTLGGRR